MAEGSRSPDIAPQQEVPKQNPTEASRGFLGRMVHGAKEAGIAMAVGLTPGGPIGLALRRERLAREAEMAQTGLTAMPEVATSAPEVHQQTPTEGSKGFLKDWFNKDKKSMAEKIALYGGPAVTFLLSIEIPGDIAQGDYRRAAVKGVIAGLSAVPAIIKGTGPLRR